MFFKFQCWVLALFLLSSCERFLGPSAQDKPNQVEADLNTQLACIAEVPQQINRYLQDNMSEQEIRSQIRCLHRAIDEFVLLTEPDAYGNYTAPSLRYYLNRYLLQDNQIGVPLLEKAMAMKAFLIGGDDIHLTPLEVKKTKDFLFRLEQVLLSLRGSVRVLTLDKPLETESVQNLQHKLGQAAKLLFAQHLPMPVRYSVGDFSDLIRELADYLGDPSLRRFSDRLPLLIAAKEAFLAPQMNINNASEWAGLEGWVIQAWGLLIELRAHMLPPGVVEPMASTGLTPARLGQLVKMVEQGLQLVIEAPVFKTSAAAIPVQYFDHFIRQILLLPKLKTRVSEGAILSAYKMIILRVFDQRFKTTVQSSGLQRIEQGHLLALQQEVRIWANHQRDVNQFFESFGQSTAPLAAIEQHFLKKYPQPVARDLFVQSITTGFQMGWTPEATLVLASAQPQRVTDFIGLTWQNIMHSVTRLVFRGYGETSDNQFSPSFVSLEGLTALEQDFQALGRDLGWLDPRSASPVARTFQEANFFTPSGDGNDELSAREVLEELCLMLSGGQQLILKWKKLAKAIETGRVDVMNMPIWDERQAINIMLKEYPTWFASMPQLVQMLQGLNEADRYSFFAQLYDISRLRIPEKKSGTIEFAEIRMMTMIIQYIEVLMMLYDLDGSRALNAEEVMLAFPRFRSFMLANFPGGWGSWLTDDAISNRFIPAGKGVVMHAFLALVFTAQVDPVKMVEEYSWMQLQDFLAIKELGEVDRLHLVKVFGVLKEYVSKPK